MSRLPNSKRNALIDDFHNGIEDPNYEVIPSKTTKGRYTVRKRKTELPSEPVSETPNEPIETPIKETPKEDDIEVDDQEEGMFNPIAYLQEYQLQVNKLLIEQMKALRVNNKYMMKKQNKYKERQKKIRDIFTEIANRPDEPEENEPEKVEEPQETHEERYEEQPQATKSYFDNTYENKIPVKEVEYETPPPPVEMPVYQNDYEEELDNLSGPRFLSSRRNRIKAFI